MLRLITIGLCLTIAACTPVKMPPMQMYALSFAGAPVPAKHTTHKTLLIGEPTASPGYDSRQMIYVTTVHELKAFSKNQWVAPPAKLLQPLLVQSLQNTRYFHAVVAEPFIGKTDYRLDVNVREFQQAFYQKPSTVRIVLEAALTNQLNHKVVASQRFVSTLPTPEDNPYGGVLAANIATKKLLSQIANFSRRALA